MLASKVEVSRFWGRLEGGDGRNGVERAVDVEVARVGRLVDVCGEGAVKGAGGAEKGVMDVTGTEEGVKARAIGGGEGSDAVAVEGGAMRVDGPWMVGELDDSEGMMGFPKQDVQKVKQGRYAEGMTCRAVTYKASHS